MMGLPAKTRIWIAAGVTDLRRGFTGLGAQVQTKLEQSPFSGHGFPRRAAQSADGRKLAVERYAGLCRPRKRTVTASAAKWLI